jgi:protein-arginine kinase activator protein McsA
MPAKAAPTNRAFASPKTFEEQLKDLTLDALNKLLDDSLNNEDYEKAAKVRDELNRRGY